MVGGCSRFDVEQGELEDCWFLCACVAITLKSQYMGNVGINTSNVKERKLTYILYSKRKMKKWNIYSTFIR